MLILAVRKVPRELDVIESVENAHLVVEMGTCLISAKRRENTSCGLILKQGLPTYGVRATIGTLQHNHWFNSGTLKSTNASLWVPFSQSLHNCTGKSLNDC